MFRTAPYTDAAAVRRTLRGDANAFGPLVRRYHRAVMGLCYGYLRNRADAEDAAQEAFIRAYTRLNTLAEPGRFGPWLMIIARNASLNAQAKRRTAAEALRAAGQAVPLFSADEPKDRAMDDARIDALLAEHLAQLPDEHREVLTLHYFAGNDTREIARILDISREAAKKRLQRSRDLLGANLLPALQAEAAQGRLSEERLQRLVRTVIAVPVPWLAVAASASAFGGTALAAAGLGASAIVAAAAAWWFMPDDSQYEPVAVLTDIDQTAPLIPQPSPPPVAQVVATEPSAPLLARPEPIEGRYNFPVHVYFADGRPAEGALVAAHSAVSDEPIAEALSDERGKALLDFLPFGAFTATARHGEMWAAGRLGVIAFNPGVVELPAALVLDSMDAVTGRVVDARTREGLAAVVTPIRSSAEVSSIVCGPEGGFEFAAPARSTWQLRVSAEGYGAVLTEPVRSGAPPLTVALPPGASIAGRCIDEATGEGLPGIALSLKRPGGLPDVETVTAKDGEYRFADLAAGAYGIAIGESAFTLAGDMEPFVVESGRSLERDLLLNAGGAIEGRIEGVDDRVSLEGAQVTAVLTEQQVPDSNLRNGLVNDDFSFRIAGLRAGEYTVCLQYGGYRTHYVKAIVGGAGETAYVSFALEENTGAIIGRVVDVGGAPVAGARVSAVGADLAVSTGQSGRDGRYLLDFVPSGRHLRLTASFAERNSATTETIELAPGEEIQAEDIVLDREASGRVTGVVANRRSEGGLYFVQIRAEDGQFRVENGGPQTARTTETGFFALNHLLEGTYTLSVYGSNARLAEESVLLTATNPERHLRIVVDPADAAIGRIEGVVVDENGEPVSGVIVLAKSHATGDSFGAGYATNAEGRWTISNLQEGETYALTAYNDRGQTGKANATVGQSDVVIRLSPRTYPIKGRVVDGRTGEAIDEYQAVYERNDGIPVPLREHDAEGNFIGELRQTTADFIIEAPGYRALRQTVDLTLQTRDQPPVEFRMSR